MSWIWLLVVFVIGAFVGYYVKDNLSKPDQSVQVDLKLKKNQIIKSKIDLIDTLEIEKKPNIFKRIFKKK